MFKKYKDFICEIEDISGSAGTQDSKDTSIDADGPVVDEWLSVDIDVESTEDEDLQMYVSAYLPDKIHMFKDLEISPDWHEKWTLQMKQQMISILSKAEEDIMDIFREAVIKSKKIIAKTGEDINKLDPVGKTRKKYGI